MRVLHLIDAASPQANPTTLALLAASLGRLDHAEQHVLLLGGTSLARSAEQAGITQAQRRPVPFGRAILDLAALRHVRDDQYDLIHCWSIGSFTLASLRQRGTPRLLTLSCPPTPRQRRWLRALVSDAATPAAILTISSTLRRDLLSCGTRESAVHVLRPAIDMAMVRHAARDELRQRWGIDDPDVRIIALLADPPAAGDTMAALTATLLAAEIHADRHQLSARTVQWARLLVHPDQHNRQRALAIAQQGDRRKSIITEPKLDRPWLVLPGCDAAINLRDGGGGLSLLWAMAANVPVIGEADYAISEIIEDRHSGLLALPEQTRALTHRLTQLLHDPQLAWKLRDTARNEAYSFFSRHQYCHNLQGVYAQHVEGKPIDVPAQPITGGLRFAGRA